VKGTTTPPGEASGKPPVTAQSRFVVHDDLSLHHLDAGKHGGHPVILLHGIRLHAHVWNNFARRFNVSSTSWRWTSGVMATAAGVARTAITSRISTATCVRWSRNGR
jgi:pimeloyl-ACP methyl ester carboxylesterase